MYKLELRCMRAVCVGGAEAERVRVDVWPAPMSAEDTIFLQRSFVAIEP